MRKGVMEFHKKIIVINHIKTEYFIVRKHQKVGKTILCFQSLREVLLISKVKIIYSQQGEREKDEKWIFESNFFER